MKLLTSSIVSLILWTTIVSAKWCANINQYDTTWDYSDRLQDLINEANRLRNPVVYLDPGVYSIRSDKPILLKEGVSLKGNQQYPTIITVKDKNAPAIIEVDSRNKNWSIQDLVLENVRIEVNNQQNEDEVAIYNNVFFNGGRGSIVAKQSNKLYIDGNIFLRDELHAATERYPSYNTTNTGILFQTQKESVVSNNIFGIDLRNVDELEPVINPSLRRSYNNLRYVYNCLNRDIPDEQGFLASGVQLYSTNDITIRENILNATFPDTRQIHQDHGISIVGSNQTYIYQNFIAGWQIADFGGAVRFTSAVDGYVISNYLANTGIMMYAAVHADFLQVSNMVIHNNFLYRFLGSEMSPPAPLSGWLYEGITFYDFYTARANYTSPKPVWDSSVAISPLGWHIVVSSNKFGAVEDLDPNVISLGNLDPKEGLVDNKNCYVTEPLEYNPFTRDPTVSLLWRQIYEEDRTTKNGGKVPKRVHKHITKDLYNEIPAALRNLPVPSFWRAFTLKNNTVPMISPETPCFS
ncbi:hypothetical protein BCV72DRAFT_247524 [Rhizopus microsporus var. microsporus]|uniref:Pectin lyase-like protein n=2 Tax=Rhizopus microsporus TaxID=58291 RepID=A0A2G4SH80_RHIZD|nr:uncharacterized protein RHIMIDRAFT_241869 [Rhizopus microsporus ATCC 52813]ORE10456.1 hypothetical protein BCV72DRAFT_247524 [Rhizopus microsporus var. microsporus]PHZ08130.1 hypothetical protein RHIMIDRAFT_241869 [Rhizopus microsporus ATCC 52813]